MRILIAPTEAQLLCNGIKALSSCCCRDGSISLLCHEYLFIFSPVSMAFDPVAFLIGMQASLMRSDPALTAGLKATPVILLAMGVFSSLGSHPSPEPTYARWVAAGLLASACGDVFLEFENREAFSHAGLDFFLLGLVAFFIGHVAYVAAFWGGALPPVANSLPVLGYSAFITWVLWPHVPADLRLPVLAYVAVISTMAVRAFGRHYVPMKERPGAASFLAAAAGALLFVTSDSVLACNKFLPEFMLQPQQARLVVMSTYYLAQLLIAASATTNMPWGAYVKLHKQ